MTNIQTVDGRPEIWIVYSGIGGYVCAVPDPEGPDGLCGIPVESEPCSIHFPEAAR